MAYVTRAQVTAKLPPQFLLQALDDNGDGTEDTDLFDAVVAGADAEVDGILGQRFDVPFTGTVPPIVGQAALIFVLDTLYLRRGYGTEANPNPVAGRAKDMRKKLEDIAKSDQPLAPEVSSSRPKVTVISQTSRVYSPNGNAVL